MDSHNKSYDCNSVSSVVVDAANFGAAHDDLHYNTAGLPSLYLNVISMISAI